MLSLLRPMMVPQLVAQSPLVYFQQSLFVSMLSSMLPSSMLGPSTAAEPSCSGRVSVGLSRSGRITPVVLPSRVGRAIVGWLSRIGRTTSRELAIAGRDDVGGPRQQVAKWDPHINETCHDIIKDRRAHIESLSTHPYCVSLLEADASPPPSVLFSIEAAASEVG